MKKYKNISISVACYIVAVVWFLSTEHSLFYNFPSAVVIPSAILALGGIMFGLKSVTTRESVWIGRLSVLIGLIILLLSIFALMMELSPI